ncbi:endonuclease/exonuclease/phosphatase family protein [Dyadobacter bucti]|uniref:endonuclease/exonuclease/phosphatase family protein n=1 Tax=Dyadobacter bucti TaxID=2572203 RepID=UPI00197AE809|nr:endonuclease/exonuclease/phosphatase family protein [Dyadobacter bucti]
MRIIVTFLLSFCAVYSFGQTQVKIISWNLKDFGASKSASQVNFIAETVKTYDILAIQEVVAGFGGSQAVARLVDVLNRTGSSYDYSISDPTSGSSKHKSEKYAFIWKTAKMKLIGKCWLEKRFGQVIEREPYYGKFLVGGKTFTLVNFHAITKKAQPETEVKYFKFLPAQYPDDNLIFCGDFNLPQSHSVFNPLRKRGYRPALVGQKTSLKQKCVNGDCLASEFDNFFYNPARVTLVNRGLIHFYRGFGDLKTARKLTDHVPIVFVFSFASGA